MVDIVAAWTDSMINLLLPRAYAITLTLHYLKHNRILLNRFKDMIQQFAYLKYLLVEYGEETTP